LLIALRYTQPCERPLTKSETPLPAAKPTLPQVWPLAKALWGTGNDNLVQKFTEARRGRVVGDLKGPEMSSLLISTSGAVISYTLAHGEQRPRILVDSSC
jgi:hypothetical protein